MDTGRKKVIITIAVGLAAFLFQLWLQEVMRPYAMRGMYFQKWSSEYLMQTVSIEDLRDAPVQTLLHIHIQPPALDMIRAILAAIWASPDSFSMLRNVDQSLYLIWAILFGFMGALIFHWLAKLTRTSYALVATVLFLVHPASIFYATLLDGTMLSTVLILWSYYLVWRFRISPDRPIALLIAAVLALFLTRSIFQWPAVLVFGLALFLLNVPKRKIIVFLIVCGVLTGLYTGKQYYQFGISSTSSFTGLNLMNSIGRSYMKSYWSYLENINPNEQQENDSPSVLVRKEKLEGTPNFNHASYLPLNRYLIENYKQELAEEPAGQLAASYLQNLLIYFLPSSIYSNHVIVDRLPWRRLYDTFFSFPILPGLILLSVVLWIVRVKRTDCLPGLGVALPGVFIVFVSILFEKGENMRFKFFMEPVFYIFIVSQLYVAGELIYRKVRSKDSDR